MEHEAENVPGFKKQKGDFQSLYKLQQTLKLFFHICYFCTWEDFNVKSHHIHIFCSFCGIPFIDSVKQLRAFVFKTEFGVISGCCHMVMDANTCIWGVLPCQRRHGSSGCSKSHRTKKITYPLNSVELLLMCHSTSWPILWDFKILFVLWNEETNSMMLVTSNTN